MSKEERTEKFCKQTEHAILNCSKWLEENAERLSCVIADGCTDWDIDFSWHTITESSELPKIDISISKLGMPMIEAYMLM